MWCFAATKSSNLGDNRKSKGYHPVTVCPDVSHGQSNPEAMLRVDWKSGTCNWKNIRVCEKNIILVAKVITLIDLSNI